MSGEDESASKIDGGVAMDHLEERRASAEHLLALDHLRRTEAVSWALCTVPVASLVFYIGVDAHAASVTTLAAAIVAAAFMAIRSALRRARQDRDTAFDEMHWQWPNTRAYAFERAQRHLENPDQLVERASYTAAALDFEDYSRAWEALDHIRGAGLEGASGEDAEFLADIPPKLRPGGDVEAVLRQTPDSEESRRAILGFIDVIVDYTVASVAEEFEDALPVGAMLHEELYRRLSIIATQLRHAVTEDSVLEVELDGPEGEPARVVRYEYYRHDDGSVDWRLQVVTRDVVEQAQLELCGVPEALDIASTQTRCYPGAEHIWNDVILGLRDLKGNAGKVFPEVESFLVSEAHRDAVNAALAIRGSESAQAYAAATTQLTACLKYVLGVTMTKPASERLPRVLSLGDALKLGVADGSTVTLPLGNEVVRLVFDRRLAYGYGAIVYRRDGVELIGLPEDYTPPQPPAPGTGLAA